MDIDATFQSLCSNARYDQNLLRELQAQCTSGIVLWQAGTESTEPWGYYTPRIVHHYTVGGVKRGRLIKNMPDTAHPTHRFLYGINARRQLVFIRDQVTKDHYEHSYLLHEPDRIIGVTVDDNHPDQVCRLTECIFNTNRQITDYRYLYLIDREPYEFLFEEYRYDSDHCLTELQQAEGLKSSSPDTFSIFSQKCLFYHDQEMRFTGWREQLGSNCNTEADPVSELYTISPTRADILPAIMTI